MSPCKGYKRKCWLAAASGQFSQYCSACQRASDIDAFDKMLKESEWLPASLFLESLKSVYAIRLQKQFKTRAIEKALSVLVERREKQLLYDHVEWIQNNSSLAPVLYHSIHTHARGDMCKSYLWLLLHKKTAMFPLPTSCAQCILNCALYSDCLTQTQRGDFSMFIHSHRITPLLATALRYNHDAYSLFDRYRAEINPTLFMIQPGFWEFLFRHVFMHAGRPANEFQQWWASTGHPLLLRTQPFTPSSKQFVKNRLAAYHEELVAYTWQTSRLMMWCLDIEELREIMD